MYFIKSSNIFKSKIEKFCGALRMHRQIHFIYRKYHALAGRPKNGGDFLVQRSQPFLGVYHEYYGVGCDDGKVSLFICGVGYNFFGNSGRCKHSACIHQKNIVGELFNYDIAGDSGLVMHNGNPARKQPVEKPAFAHIRPSDQSYAFFFR